MKHLSISLLALTFVCAPVMGQQLRSPGVPPDNASYQSNVAVPPPAPLPLSASAAAPGQPASVPGLAAAAIVAPSPGTASEQGYTGHLIRGPSPWDAETLRRRESPRQRGERVDVSSRKNGVGTDAASRGWFAAWEVRLVSIGVHPDKVKFEGRRLTQDQFAMWASRQVWAVEAGLIAP